jgi:hypothetical protein
MEDLMRLISSRISEMALGLIVLGFITLSQATQTPGTWKNVTLNNDVATGYSGIVTMLADPVRKSDVWFLSAYKGIWKSTDAGETWAKANTGTNGAKLEDGRPWYSAIDMNPNRDPNTDPVIYTTMGYGSGGVYKSTDGGVNWIQAWNNNIFLEDGVTNISADVGGDIHAVCISDKVDPNHVIISLHSYWGTSGNNGVFETTNGGTTWTCHKAQTFNFQPHSDDLFPISASTWIVGHGTNWPSGDIYRTTNSGTSWTVVKSGAFFGRLYNQVGSTLYATSGRDGLWKSTNSGETWTKLAGAPGNPGIPVATGSYLYMLSGQDGNQQAFSRAPINNDATWTAAPGSTDTAMKGGACAAVSAYDGTHWVIVSPQASAGVWRYIEQDASSEIAMNQNQKARAPGSKSSQSILKYSALTNKAMTIVRGNRMYDITGKAIRLTNLGR